MIELNGAELARDDEGFLHGQYREHGHTPSHRNLLQDLAGLLPERKASRSYDLFPGAPAKQGVRIAGLPKPFGRGGY